MNTHLRRILVAVLAMLGCEGAVSGCALARGQTARKRAPALSPSVNAVARRASAAPAPPATRGSSSPSPEPLPAAHATDAGSEPLEPRCNEQQAQEFLRKAHMSSHAMNTPDERADWDQISAASIRYRTEQYGYFEGFGQYAWNSKKPSAQVQLVKFFGVPVIVHERIVPALKCVERAIHLNCATHPYQPGVLSGLRKHNTYSGGEVSNHVYGIALDIDPMRNPCCHCVEPWKSSPRCDGEKTKWQRMDMPECWVTEFERYGFHWLGHDAMEDTMHFEFLGDPNRILAAIGDAPGFARR
jgi:hypothetical protein